MTKHSQTIRRQPTNCLSVFDHFVGLALKGLIPPIFHQNFLETRIDMIKPNQITEFKAASN